MDASSFLYKEISIIATVAQSLRRPAPAIRPLRLPIVRPLPALGRLASALASEISIAVAELRGPFLIPSPTTARPRRHQRPESWAEFLEAA